MTTPLWVTLVQTLAVFTYFLLFTAMLIWAERRVVGRMQSRIGPNRIGPGGVLQTLIDGLKMFFKEDFTPSMVKNPVFTLAPIIAVVAGFLTIAVIPISGPVTLFGETFTLVVADLHVGVLWILALSSLHVYGVFLAGWSSNSPYPLMGGIRASAQMISYEIAQGLAVASVFVYAGTFQVSEIIAQQSGVGPVNGVPGWFVLPLFPAFIVFVVGMVAEAGRPPFDLAEAEGELVGGFHTEYSGIRFGMFMLAEFMAVVVMSAIVVTLFLGGPAGPTFGLSDSIAWLMSLFWFTAKTAGFVFFFILLRGALPRTRYHRLMDLGWKVLIPIALVWVMITAAWVLINEGGGIPANVRVWLAVIAGGLLVWVFFTASRDENTAQDTATTSEPKKVH
ncbi:MAG: NADH-quinone oxidoreductase subunit H [Nitriliruptoraceae bacterium]